MVTINNLKKAILSEEYFLKQFSFWGNEKNILFVNPQMSGRYVYKMILPFFSMLSEDVRTAITGVNKFDYEGQILGEPIELSDEMIEWADFIVFPFTSQPLVSEYYERINNKQSGSCKIVFCLDFNFYEMSPSHPLSYIFQEPTVISAIEDNIWYADICMLSNAAFSQYLSDKFTHLSNEKYKDIPTRLMITCMPTMIDTEIVLKNIAEYDPERPVLVNMNPNQHASEVKKHIEEVAKVAEEVKQSAIEKEMREHAEAIKREKEEKAEAEKIKKQAEAELNKPKTQVVKKDKSSPVVKKTKKTQEIQDVDYYDPSGSDDNYVNIDADVIPKEIEKQAVKKIKTAKSRKSKQKKNGKSGRGRTKK